jgi:hypothetical protein
MGNNMFLKKYKFAVNNSDLRKINELEILVEGANNDALMSVYYDNSVGMILPDIRSTGTVYFYKANGVDFYGDIPNCQHVPGRTSYGFVEFKVKGTGKIFIADMQNVNALSIVNRCSTDCSLLYYKAKNLKTLRTTNGTLTGELEELSNIDLQTISLGRYDKAWNVSIFSKCINLIDFLPGIDESKNGYGTIEDFVEQQIANGRNSGTLDVSFKNSQVTLNGSHDPLDVGRVLVVYNGSNVTISVKSSGTQIASYNGSTWTYA